MIKSKNGISAANFGDASMFSFHATKVYNTVEGGAVCFRDDGLVQLLNDLKNFGMITRKLGYSVGDGILHEVAQFFSSLHPEGRAYRIASVSFAVLLPLQHAAEQEVAIEKIQNRFEKTWQVGRASCTLPFHGASLLYQLQPWTAEQVMIYLEYTLAQAKNDEKQMLLFDDQIEKRYQRRQFR